MLDNAKAFNAATNSHETSTRDTGSESLIALTGNPYTDLAAYGIDLHGCAIRYLRSPNRTGHTVTGRFNVCGREQTAGGVNYQSLILSLVARHREYRHYVADCRKRKRKRNYASWLSRHPQMVLHNRDITLL